MQKSSSLKLALLLSVLVVALTNPVGGAEKPDPDLIQGRWRVVGVNREGREFDSRKVERLGLSMRFAGRNLTQAAAGAKAQDGTFKMDEAKKPKRLTISPKDGGQPQAMMIYDLDGDRLRVASVIGDGAEPPPDFEPKQGRVVMTLERQKE